MEGNSLTSTLTCLRDKAYNDAKEKGFHDKEYSDEHWLMLIVCEIAEAVEADRRDMHANMNAYETNIRCGEKSDVAFCRHIKDTVEDELADVCIRILDLIGLRHLTPDFDKYFDEHYDDYILNENGDTLEIVCYDIVGVLVTASDYGALEDEYMTLALEKVFSWCYCENIDILRHIQLKMEYNRTRPRLHGKRY